jgi:hypothetical protein
MSAVNAGNGNSAHSRGAVLARTNTHSEIHLSASAGLNRLKEAGSGDDAGVWQLCRQYAKWAFADSIVG